MTSDKQLKRDFEKDRSRLAELNKQYFSHEEILLENLYRSKRKLEKISEEKQLSFVRWKTYVNAAANTSTLLEPAEFKAVDGLGKKRLIKIGPKTNSHDVRKAVGMHDTHKYDEKRKRESVDWNRNRKDFGAQMSDILKKKNHILGFSSSDNSFDLCFDEPACNPHTTPANVVYHTSFRQPPPDKKLEIEFREVSAHYKSIERERNQLLQENEELTDSLKSTQEQMRQIAVNRDEHILTNRRYAEEKRKLQRELEFALDSTQTQAKAIPVHRVTFDDDSDKLRGEVENLSKSLAKIKNDREPDDILRDVGIESRVEFLQTSKAGDHTFYGHSRNSRYSDLSTDFDTPSMKPGTGNSHRGNVRADAVMLSINAGHWAKFHTTFEEVYGVSVDDVKRGRSNKYAPQSKVTEILNMRGTMAHRGCFTNHTPDKDADDDFMTLSDYCDSEFQDAMRRSSTTLRAARTFSENPDIICACEKMRRICDIVVGTTRIKSLSPPLFLSGGLKSYD